MKRFCCAFLLTISCAAGAMSQTRVYEGTEAGALRCANMMALTAIVLSDTDRMGEQEKDVMIGISFLILQGHVSGTWAEKKAALEVVRDRRGVQETLDDFERLAEQCLRDFPIN
ncbi:hypothetical protein CEP88_07295 [Roseobacter denitrificans]|uniref:Lipoprotein n=3 Tax=Roseobacter denitrificans TaxID=2434 RepID=Q162Q8_ROSDO|nr:hypothetical protein RD1_3553 [Roseobacter denitrificans OCh 114]AVL52411.1 hypothetical protein CEP88_07295 [Roseobacter denitrificans]